jgi:hypothetical protein
MRAMDLCGECRRHVRAGETSCPFCGSTASRAPHVLPRAQRIARAAGYASAVLIAGLGGGCAESRVPEDDAGTAVVDAGRDAGVAVPDAGVADAGTPADAGPDADAEVPVPLYGGAFPDPRRRAVI